MQGAHPLPLVFRVRWLVAVLNETLAARTMNTDPGTRRILFVVFEQLNRFCHRLTILAGRIAAGENVAPRPRPTTRRPRPAAVPEPPPATEPGAEDSEPAFDD